MRYNLSISMGTQPQSHIIRESVKQERFLNMLEAVHTRLWRYAEALCKNRHDAEDLVSETVLIAYKQMDKLHDENAFVFYVFTIARRLHRKRKWKLRFFSELPTEHEDLTVTPEAQPDVQADFSALYKALDTLPAAMKEAVVLFELSDMTLEEIRVIQGGSLSGVKSRVTRGRERLAKILGK
ncbi:MAG: sigma-70 family RNA polymerase sigma factor [Candidatus Kapabacteria bacterium]|nr:sigma-70 family RNA polymerase sigma factor [Candidatus Kapabacteria bacterium]